MTGDARVAKVIIPSVMRHVSNGAEVVEVEGATLKEVIAQLDAKCPGIRDLLLDDRGVKHHVAFFIDGVDARSSGGLMAPVPEGAEVVIVPAISGGSAGSGSRKAPAGAPRGAA